MNYTTLHWLQYTRLQLQLQHNYKFNHTFQLHYNYNLNNYNLNNYNLNNYSYKYIYTQLQQLQQLQQHPPLMYLYRMSLWSFMECSFVYHSINPDLGGIDRTGWNKQVHEPPLLIL